jgi:hypothetical protein
MARKKKSSEKSAEKELKKNKKAVRDAYETGAEFADLVFDVWSFFR